MLRRFVFSICIPLIAFSAADARALTTLKKIQITDGARVDLFFDAKVSSGQVRTEFVNDIIQLSLEDVSIYPAKITSIAGADLTKVFAYQYTPKLVRARFTVKGKAESYKGRLTLENNGKVLTLKIAPGSSDQVVTSASQAVRVEPMDGDQKALLEKVMKAAEEAPKPPKKLATPLAAPAASPITTGKPLPSPWRSLAMLGAVLALFCGTLFGIKKFSRGGGVKNIQRHKAFTGFLSRIGVGSTSKMIEVVSTHHLGPKKSISVVRVGGRTLVLGITNDSINLITQIEDRPGAAARAVQEFDESHSPSDVPPPARAKKSDSELFDLFSEELARESDLSPEPLVRAAPPAAAPARAPSQAPNHSPNPALANRPSVRAQIRSRLEGLKQL